MANFGIVSEGRTDRFVLTNILKGHQSDRDGETVINAVQPVDGETFAGTQPPPGGWTLVFDFLRRGEYKDALQVNDYLVLQLDTDVCDHVGFDVPRRAGERELAPDELVACVIARLEREIDPAFYAIYRARFIFAIAVDEIECWLLPLLFDSEPVKAAKVTGCLEAASHKLRLLKRAALQQGEHKDERAYKAESQPYRKRATLMKQGPRNPSLKIFLDELTTKTTPPPVIDAPAG